MYRLLNLMGCPFCKDFTSFLEKSELAISVLDKYPVTEFHSLVIPNRHVESFFELTQKEYLDCISLLHKTQKKLFSFDKQISGFNIGINDGKDAGQTISHCHIHLIPRRKNDVKNPSGGVRHVIPDKGNYEAITAKYIQEEKFKTISAY